MGFSFINHPFWGTTISGNPPNLRYSVIELKPHNWAVSFHLANHLGHRKIPWPQARPALRAGVGNRWWRVPEFLSLEVEEFRSPSAKSLRKPPPISPGSALPMIWGEKKGGKPKSKLVMFGKTHGLAHQNNRKIYPLISCSLLRR